jgi:hypothetical protein
MNWKCPQCGEEDNEKCSNRCSCGYEFDEKSPSIVQWVQPTIRSPIPQPSGPKPPKTNKQKLGEVMYIIPIVALLSSVVVPLVMGLNPSKRTMMVIISASIFVSTLSSLLTDDIGIRGYGVVNRFEKPRIFWYLFVFQSILTVAFLCIAIL